ncbi:hypothetical protein AAFC00_002430 [Neodothiora populina]|uniref:Folylpolyglutamate synthase n=1 Tax=Neodothiora populina TaxID=2781224 RepID=A0ABR3P735_9PEZI
MQGDYSAAVAALNTLQSNFAIVDAIRKSGKGMNKMAIPEMIEWVKRIGYEPSDFDKLKAIHVAGTKGKGSTSSFVSSILQQYTGSLSVKKVGLYTSPHLRFVRERIQIDNAPLSEEMFAKYFFETWNRLEQSAEREGHPDPQSRETKPVYFRFLTLMALHTYMSEGVDCAVIECGIGGEYDSTNMLVNPSVCGVTSLGIDHTAMLGDTIESIAWHKAGIFKAGVPALTVPQPAPALAVLKERAQERQTTLTLTSVHRSIASGDITLGLAADFQKTNASLAIAMAAAHLVKQGVKDLPTPGDSSSPLPAEFRAGLEQVKLGGRCQVRPDPSHSLTWYIDGGHTLESIEMAGRWFASHISPSSSSPSSQTKQPRILIFNQQTRDADSLARRLHSTLATALDAAPPSASSSSSAEASAAAERQTQRPFTAVIFCTNETYATAGFKPDLASMNTDSTDVSTLRVQHDLANTWRAVDAAADVRIERTIEEAIALARQIASASASDDKERTQTEADVKVLVTGSLHLVGGLLEVLESEDVASSKTT